VWRRFRSGLDGFTFVKEADHFAAHVGTTAERSVDLFSVLLAHLRPAVDVAFEDPRGKRKWTGSQIALPDVQDAIARLKAPLAGAGGVEIAIYTAEDQISLSRQVELFVYSRTDRWLYLLLGLGLEERSSVPRRGWKPAAHDFDRAPELSSALETAADRLGLAVGRL
jgi:hypothetical protein